MDIFVARLVDRMLLAVRKVMEEHRFEVLSEAGGGALREAWGEEMVVHISEVRYSTFTLYTYFRVLRHMLRYSILALLHPLYYLFHLS